MICFLLVNALVEINTIINSLISQENFIGLFFLFLIIITVLLLLWDLVIKIFSIEGSNLLKKLAIHQLKKKRIGFSIFCVRLNYGFSKLMYFLRLGWIRMGSDHDIVWKSINRPPIKDTVFKICFSLIRLRSLIALLLVAISLEWIQLSNVPNQIDNFFRLEFDFAWFMKILPSLAIIVLLACIGYFISLKGNIRRSVAQANRKKMEDVIQKQKDLNEVIGDCIYPIASNLKYVIDCQDLVAELWTYNKVEVEDKRLDLSRKRNVDYYCFKDIPELEYISEKIYELNSIENRSAFRAFASHKYEFISFWASTYALDKGKLNKIFFTKEGIKTQITSDKRPMIKDSDIENNESIERYLEWIPGGIIDSVELLYKFSRYNDEINRMLNFKSDKVGRILRMFTGKE